MGISFREAGKELDFFVSGRIDSKTAAELDSVLRLIEPDTERIVFDFSELDYISSVGLREILQIREALRADAEIRIVGASPEVAEVFRMTGFDQYVKLETAEEKDETMALRKLFARQCERAGDRVFISAQKQYTFDDINQRSQLLAFRLFREGVHKGSHVGLYGTNSLNWVTAFFAIQKCGAIALPLSYSYTADDLVSLSGIGDITHLCAGDTAQTADYERFRAAVTGGGSRIRRVIDIRSGSKADPADPAYEDIAELFQDPQNAEDDCIMLFTSGSTGKPKAVLHSSLSILHSARCAVDVMKLTPEDSICMNVPFSHTLGLVRCFLAGLIAGARLELPESFAPADLIAFVDERKCTIMNAIPTTVVSMANDASFAPEKVSSIRCSILVGAPVTETQMRTLMELFPNNHFISSYGMSELSPITMTEYGDTAEHICRTVGKPSGGVEVQIRHLDTGKPLDPASGMKGEIAVRGTSTMTGYYKLDPASQAIDKEGWVKTGDFGFFDPEGYLHIGGRMKELIHTSGKTVEPNLVGSVISTCPAVADVKVTGIPDPKRGEIVVACVTEKSGKRIDWDELKGMLREKLEDYQVPVAFLVYDSLPVLSNGKVDAVFLKTDAQRRLAERSMADGKNV